MSTLDEIINEGLKEWREKQAAEERRDAEREFLRTQNELICFREVVYQGLGLEDEITEPSIQIDEFTLAFSHYQSGWVNMRLSFTDDYTSASYAMVDAAVNVFKAGEIRLHDRTAFLVSISQAADGLRKAREDWNRRQQSAMSPAPAPSMPTPKVKLDADALNTIWFCKELIDALETGCALTEKQLYVMATIRYTNAIERWTRNDDE